MVKPGPSPRMLPLPAGEYNQRITICQPATQQLQNGERVEIEPTEITTTRAKSVAASGGEGFRGRQVDATATHVVVIRYRDDVTPKMWVKWGDRRLNIIHAGDRMGNRRELEIVCKEQR